MENEDAQNANLENPDRETTEDEAQSEVPESRAASSDEGREPQVALQDEAETEARETEGRDTGAKGGTRPKEARGEKSPDADEDTPARARKQRKRTSRIAVTIVTGVVCLAVGCAIGHFVLGGPAAIGSSTLSEGDLSKTIATYSSSQGSGSLTVRDVYNANGSLQSAEQTDGSYTAPSADAVLTAARNSILTSAAEAQGLDASDDDIAQYAKSTFGTDSLDTLAQTYSTDADTVKSLLRQTVLQSKLREQVVGNDTAATAPEAPKAPKSGKSTAESKTYAKYIIKLAGSEWSKSKNSWKSSDGPYAQALASYDVSNDKASYEAAQAAYNVAYSQYASQASSTNGKWTDYVNGLLTTSSIQIGTIGS